MRESQIEALLVRRVQAAGGLCLKFTSPGRRHVPDRIVLMPGGLVVFVEVKRPGEVPRPGQEREHQRLRALGATVTVVDDEADIDVLVAGLQRQRCRALAQESLASVHHAVQDRPAFDRWCIQHFGCEPAMLCLLNGDDLRVAWSTGAGQGPTS